MMEVLASVMFKKHIWFSLLEKLFVVERWAFFQDMNDRFAHWLTDYPIHDQLISIFIAYWYGTVFYWPSHFTLFQWNNECPHRKKNIFTCYTIFNFFFSFFFFYCVLCLVNLYLKHNIFTRLFIYFSHQEIWILNLLKMDLSICTISYLPRGALSQPFSAPFNRHTATGLWSHSYIGDSIYVCPQSASSFLFFYI